MLTVAAIRIYPVKGLRAVPLAEAEVEPWGLAGDRRWMVVDERGRFLSQRERPAMAAIAARREEGALRLTARDGSSIVVEEPRGGSTTVTVWRDAVEARPADAAAGAWLAERLGTPCRLAFMADPATARAVDPDYGAPEDRVSFADGFPLLVTLEASLADLNARLATPVGMDRFRANLVVSGGSPWMEDGWRRLRVGNVDFAAVKDCARCAVPTVDQETGLRAADGEPLRTLARFRRKAGGRIIFGQNLVPRGLGRIAIGDIVEAD